MNRNLNSSQFQLFDPGPETGGDPVKPFSFPEDYPSPYSDPDEDRLTEPNPLFSDDPIPSTWDMGDLGDPQEEFVPSWKIKSVQDSINEPAVEHLSSHATGTTEPNITVVQGEGETTGESWLFDGNHRVNAAQRRGQMFIPADVYRARRR